MENSKVRPSRFQRCFRIAFNFFEERNGARGSGCSEGEFWRDTANLVADAAARMDNDPLLAGLLGACMEELERLDRADRRAAHAHNKHKVS